MDSQGRSYSESLSGPAIDLICNSVKLILAVNAEVCARGQVLVHQAPFMFSLEPRCEGLSGSQKYTAMHVRLLSSLCIAISRPWSNVMLKRLGCEMPTVLFKQRILNQPWRGNQHHSYFSNSNTKSFKIF